MTQVTDPSVPSAVDNVSDIVAAQDALSDGSVTRRGIPAAGFGSLQWLFTAGFALGGFMVGMRRLHDNSFFVHLSTGRWIVEHGAVPHVDSYSFTAAGEPFIAQSWLASLAYWWLNSSIGPFAIRVMMGLVGAAIAALIFTLANRLIGHRVRAAMFAVVAFAVLSTMFSERPLAFGLLGLVVLTWIIEIPDARISRRPLTALPILMWLWGNTHGSMALGYVYIGLHLLGRGLEGAWCWKKEHQRERSLAIGAVVSAVTLVVNPYGISLLTFPVALMSKGDVLRDVIEWMSPNFHTPAGMAFAVWMAVAVAVLVRSRSVSRRDTVVLIPFMLLAFWAFRNVAIATVISLPIVARAYAASRLEAASERTGDPTASKATRPENLAVGRLIGVGVIAVAVLFAVNAAGEKQYDERGYSVKASRFVADNFGTKSRLLTTDANGGWMIAAHPDQKIFMDDRYDMYPKAIVDDYMTMSRARPTWRAVLDKHRVETVVWPTASPLTQLLSLDDDFRRVYKDKEWTVFVRRS